VRRHGPHHGAENRTRTGSSGSSLSFVLVDSDRPDRTSCSNCSVVRINRPPDFATMERDDVDVDDDDDVNLTR